MVNLFKQVCRLLARLLLLGSVTGLCYAQEIAPDFSISLERTACYGTCPVYKVTISANGTVRYKGEKHVDHLGKWQGKISKDDLRELIGDVKAANFFTLKSKYANKADGCGKRYTDSPGAFIKLTMGGKTGQVYHYHGCRDGAVADDLAKLNALEQAIDDTWEDVKLRK